MQLTIGSDDPLEDVLRVLGKLYEVDLTAAVEAARESGAPVTASVEDDDGGYRTPKIRHGW